MNVLLVPVAGIVSALTVLGFAFSARRLLALNFSFTRTVVAGLIAFLLASPIITTMGGKAVTDSQSAFPGLWFGVLGVLIALLVGMVFLVVAEALVPSGSIPGPAYLVSSARRRVRRTRRYLQVLRILVRHGLLAYLRGGRRAELATPEGRARLARSVRLALDDGGVTFVKFGQLLSTRRDLLPSEFLTELGTLQDRAGQLPWPVVEQVLHTELGEQSDHVFSQIDQSPLAAASVAQVHAAQLTTGESVVVKVCRPGVRGTVESDLDILDRLARRLGRSTRWAQSIGLGGLVAGFADSLREELDLRTEAGNLAALGAAERRQGSPGSVRIPVVYRALSTSQLLVMERLNGIPLAAAHPALATRGLDGTALARTLLGTLLRQVMVDGVFHADPHPGNILLLPDGSLGLLDFGSVGRIDSRLRESMLRVLLAVDRSDPEALTDAVLEVMERPAVLDERRLERDLGQFLARRLGPEMVPDLRMFGDLVRIVSAHGLGVPAEVAAVFRTLATIEGTLDQLAPGFDLVTEARAFAREQAEAMLSPERVQTATADELVALLPLIRRIPRRLDRISGALEANRLSFNVRLLADPDDRTLLTELLHRVLLTILAATSGLMAVLMLRIRGGPRLTTDVSLYHFFGYCLLVVAAILALRVLIVIFRPTRA